ncbi:fungal-specific transcription factor domain-containing protein [Exophiala viscosa]|uniref:Fungal-specific transcription factor domain-containing protein n=1 Tax=Exophiala viscosa TaxID=2486360 RepID=A0AAN6E3D4_9EURO|nr:fungal-specific transcription factor domain-containing protein [Exophiala viscosa]KAI1630241.1 fungal-specific transcription factor domain-containing protein [Exophiala viscosa]
MTSSTEPELEQGGPDGHDGRMGGGSNDSVPRPKRIACILCRKRKLKCDGNKPSCGTCSRLDHHCEYSEERKKSGPKRGYVKLLEARLKQVENLLESKDTQSEPTPRVGKQPPTVPITESYTSIPSLDMPNMGMGDTLMSDMMQEANFTDPMFTDPNPGGMQDFTMEVNGDFSWEMIGLGLEEALPSRDVIDELNEIYFEKIHPSLPMIHKGRFLASMDLAPHMRPAVALRYAMWTHACVITPKYAAYTEHFYQRARKYAEADEMRGHGEGMITVAHCQAWTLLACHEFKLMYFPRAWMSIGRASRLALMMGLHRLDRVGLDVKQTLPPPRDWTDREERRRTFWMAYCQDRYASIGTGWPMVIDEQDILTNLPASDEAFNRCQPENILQLSDILKGEGAGQLSSFGGVILLSTIFGRNLTHLHRPDEQENDHDLNGAFWKRHRSLDNILLNTSLSLPAKLRLPAGISDPNTIFLNMNIHTATICLHQAAIFKADKNRLPAQISAESKRRCIVAADQITNIMKMISHVDMALMNPFIAFCLYVAARVFVQYLKARREDTAVKSSLHFLLAAMQVLKTKNPLTESFLVQLDVDLEGSGLDIPTSYSRWKFGRRPPGESPANTDSLKCSPLFEIRQTQNTPQNINPNPMNVTLPNEAQLNIPIVNTNQLYSGIYAPEPGNDGAQPGQFAGTSLSDAYENMYSANFPAVQSLGTDNSPGNSNQEGLGSRSQSNHPTPSTLSNHTSHTSYTSPPNQSGGNNSASGSQSQQSPSGFPFPSKESWRIATNQPGPAMSKPTPNLDFTSPGATSGPAGVTMNSTGMTPGMTPGMDSFWPAEGMGDGSEWIFGWPGSTPQPN